MIFILIIVFGLDLKPVILQQEFNSWNACEQARKEIVANTGEYLKVKSQGCYMKGTLK